MINDYGQDIDEMYESSCSWQWEELNSNDNQFPNWDDAVDKIESALLDLYTAEDKLQEAADSIDGSPEKYRIESLIESLSELANHVFDQKSRMRG